MPEDRRYSWFEQKAVWTAKRYYWYFHSRFVDKKRLGSGRLPERHWYYLQMYITREFFHSSSRPPVSLELPCGVRNGWPNFRARSTTPAECGEIRIWCRCQKVRVLIKCYKQRSRYLHSSSESLMVLDNELRSFLLWDYGRWTAKKRIACLVNRTVVRGTQITIICNTNNSNVFRCQTGEHGFEISLVNARSKNSKFLLYMWLCV